MPHPIVARLALEVLWRQRYYTARPGELEPEAEAASNALHEMLWRKEQEAAAQAGWSCQHLILRPVNPLSLPAPDEAAEIRAAIATLVRHDLLPAPGPTRWCIPGN